MAFYEQELLDRNVFSRIDGAFLDKRIFDPIDPENSEKVLQFVIGGSRIPYSGRIERSRRGHKHIVIFVACS